LLSKNNIEVVKERVVSRMVNLFPVKLIIFCLIIVSSLIIVLLYFVKHYQSSNKVKKIDYLHIPHLFSMSFFLLGYIVVLYLSSLFEILCINQFLIGSIFCISTIYIFVTLIIQTNLILDSKNKQLILHQNATEINCISEINSVFDDEELNIEEKLQMITECILITTCDSVKSGVRLVINKQVYYTKNFKRTKYFNKSIIKIKGLGIGTLEINYSKPNSLIIKTEILNIVTEVISTHLEKYNIEKNLGKTVEILKTNKELESIAYIDELTNLVNRKAFLNLVEKKIRKAKITNQKMAFLFIDLDGFKLVNDLYGHHFGDVVLKYIANMILKITRDSDFVGRMGGDEFVICLENIKSTEKVTRVAKEINNLLADKINVGGKEVAIGASIGISMFPEDGQTVVDLLKNSDLAMYNSKRTRKNSYFFYNETLQEELIFEQELSLALERHEFKLNFQPIVDKNKQLYCSEALLRWDNPKLGLIVANDFIHILEKNKSIVEVGNWVFRECCNQLVKHYEHSDQKIFISINISQYQIEDVQFINKITQILKETKVDPQNILIEITEKVQIANIDLVKDILQKLKQLGIGFIALDDFGKGYSSFSNLIRYPIDVVKIDKFFVGRLDNTKYVDITAALVQLIKKYNLNIIIEGIENKEQFELVKKIGCDYFQGYYFSKPQPSIEAEILTDEDHKSLN